MSDQFAHYAYMNKSTNLPSSFSIPGTEVEESYYAAERSWDSAIHSFHEGSAMALPQTRRSLMALNNWSMSMQPETHGPFPEWADPFHSSSFPSPRILQEISTQQGTRNNGLSYRDMGGSYPLMPGANPDRVAMPTFNEYAHYGHTDAHEYYFGASNGFTPEESMACSSQSHPSHHIVMSTMPRSLGVDGSSHSTSFLPADPTSYAQPPFPAVNHHSLLAPHLLALSIPDFNSDGSSSSTGTSPTPLSDNNHPGMPHEPPGIQLHPATPTPLDRPLAFIVPLSSVEFPSTLRLSDIPFFQCRWNGCGVWITSEKEAVKRHLTHCHGVSLKGNSPANTPCKWDGCSSSVLRDSLVRHVHTHLSLQWRCSKCEAAYTRSDSVINHARREVGCRQAHPIRSPSALAYKAKINADDSVTLTKIVQP